MQTENLKRIGTRLLATTALGALLAAAPVSLDVDLNSGVIAFEPAIALAKSGSGSDGDGGSDDRDNSGRGSHDDDDDDDRSGRGGGDDDDDSWVVEEVNGQTVRTRQRDGETRIRVRNIGEDEDLVRVRLRDGETEVRVRDPNTFEDVVRVRLRDQGDEVRVRNATTEEDLVRLREDGLNDDIVGISVQIEDGAAVVNVTDPRVTAEEILVDAGDDRALVQVGPTDIDAVRPPAE